MAVERDEWLEIDGERSVAVPREGNDWQSPRFFRWQAAVVAALIFAYSSFYISWSCLSVVQPLITQDLGYTNTQMGQILTISMFARIGPKLLSGTVVDFAGGKRSVLVGLFLTALATASFSFGSSLWWMTLTWSAVRCFNVIVWPGVMKVAAKWLHFTQIGKGMGILSLAYLFGDAAARTYLSGWVYVGVGWRGIFWIAAATMLFIITVSFFTIKDSPLHVRLVPPDDDPFVVNSPSKPAVPPTDADVSVTRDLSHMDVEESVDSVPVDNAQAAPESLRDVLVPIFTSLRFWSLLGWYALLVLLRQVFLDWTPTYLSEQCDVPDGLASLGSALFAFSGGVASLFMGYLNDRLPPNTRSWAMLPFMVILTMALAYLALMSTSGCRSGWIAVLLISIAGFFMMGPYTLSGSLSLRFGGKKMCATVSGLLDAGGAMLSVFSGTFGRLTDSDRGWADLFLVLSLLSALSSLIMVAFCGIEHVELKRRNKEAGATVVAKSVQTS